MLQLTDSNNKPMNTPFEHSEQRQADKANHHDREREIERDRWLEDWELEARRVLLTTQDLTLCEKDEE